MTGGKIVLQNIRFLVPISDNYIADQFE